MGGHGQTAFRGGSTIPASSASGPHTASPASDPGAAWPLGSVVAGSRTRVFDQDGPARPPRARRSSDPLLLRQGAVLLRDPARLPALDPGSARRGSHRRRQRRFTDTPDSATNQSDRTRRSVEGAGGTIPRRGGTADQVPRSALPVASRPKSIRPSKTNRG